MSNTNRLATAISSDEQLIRNLQAQVAAERQVIAELRETLISIRAVAAIRGGECANTVWTLAEDCLERKGAWADAQRAKDVAAKGTV